MRPKFLNNALRRKGMNYIHNWLEIAIVLFLITVVMTSLFFASWVDAQSEQQMKADLEHKVIAMIEGITINLGDHDYLKCTQTNLIKGIDQENL